MIYKNEKQLLNIIKFTPPIVIITISIIITFLLYLEKQHELKKELMKLIIYLIESIMKIKIQKLKMK